MNKFADIQALLDEATNELLALPFNDLSGLRLCLFEEANYVLVRALPYAPDP